MVVSIETIFYTQIASIIAFIVALFVLYRVLVQSKDATIEMQKSQISFLETKIKNLSETSPDILLQRYEKRTTLLTDELEKAEQEKAPLKAEIDQLQNELTQTGTKTHTEKQKLVSQLVSVSQHAAALEERHQQLEGKIRDIQDPYMQFLHYANAEVSPGRKHIVGEISQNLGLDFVIGSAPDALIKAFSTIYEETEKHGMHPEIPINGGAMTGLRSVGIISNDNILTLVGVSVFKTIARELKSNNTP
jgi:CII-binding regulator of phage lambda lysogenization HflD